MIIVLPMTGPNRFKSEKYFYPKPLLEIYQRPMVQVALEAYFDMDISLYVPIISKKDKVEFSLDAVLEQILIEKNHKIITLEGATSGSLCTTMLAVDEVDRNEELLVINYDQYLDFDLSSAISAFRDKKNDFGVICFDSTHPKWSYVELDNENMVKRVAEKKPISRNALVGVYYFKNFDVFQCAASQSLLEAPVDKTLFYVSDALNHCILSGQTGLAYQINRDDYTKFSQPSDVDDFLERRASK